MGRPPSCLACGVFTAQLLFTRASLHAPSAPPRWFVPTTQVAFAAKAATDQGTADETLMVLQAHMAELLAEEKKLLGALKKNRFGSSDTPT